MQTSKLSDVLCPDKITLSFQI